MENPAPPSIPVTSVGRRGHGKATLADVARRAGVTTMTVSRMLREPHRVSHETGERIRQALADTGYSPNKQAGVLASGRSAIVAAIIPNVANSIFAETVQGLSDVLQPAGLELLLASTNYNLEREEEQLRAVLGWAPAALVVTGLRHTAGAMALLRQAQSSGTPVIEIWEKDPTSIEFIQIGFNHRSAGQTMAQHLLDCGHTDLVYVDSGVEEDFRAHERGEGFALTAKRASARVRIIKADRGEPMAAGRKALQGLRPGPLPHGIAFANDHLAAGAWLQAQDMGIQAPQDLALLGFGDFPIAIQLGGGISTLAAPRYAIGQNAGLKILSDLGSSAASDLISSSLQPTLVIRNTTRLRSESTSQRP
jgi:LacI family gluconate utilization system Gnt-I transcriptional repressor